MKSAVCMKDLFFFKDHIWNEKPQVLEVAQIIVSHFLILQKDQEHPEDRECLLYFCVSRIQQIASQQLSPDKFLIEKKKEGRADGRWVGGSRELKLELKNDFAKICIRIQVSSFPTQLCFHQMVHIVSIMSIVKNAIYFPVTDGNLIRRAVALLRCSCFHQGT